MALRACIYKNCSNFINIKDRTINEHITLFNFPKNPERRQKWIENGKVSPKTPTTMYYYCSEHFDKGFLSVNNRRTTLVGEAIPYPFPDPLIEEVYDIDDEVNLDYILCDGAEMEQQQEQENQQEQDLRVVSTTSIQEEDEDMTELIDNALNVQDDQEYFDTSEIHQIKETNVSKKPILNNIKHKLNDSTIIVASSSKAKILRISSPLKQQSSEKITDKTQPTPSTADISRQSSNQKSVPTQESTDKSDIESEIDAELFVDPEHVTTFIFKGEEYVQMPREYYIKEKIELMEKLQKLESVVKAIKGHLNSLEC